MKIERAQTVTMYVPAHCNKSSVEAYAALVGGCTITSGFGEWWESNCTYHGEPVLVYQFVVSAYAERQKMQDNIKWTGKSFLSDNPDELCFMCTVTDCNGSTRKFTFTRKDA